MAGGRQCPRGVRRQTLALRAVLAQYLAFRTDRMGRGFTAGFGLQVRLSKNNLSAKDAKKTQSSFWFFPSCFFASFADEKNQNGFNTTSNTTISSTITGISLNQRNHTWDFVFCLASNARSRFLQTW